MARSVVWIAAALFSVACTGPKISADAFDVGGGEVGEPRETSAQEAAGEGQPCGSAFLSSMPYEPCEEGLVCVEDKLCRRPVPDCSAGMCRIPAASLLMDFTHQITTGSEEADLSVVPITPVIVAKPYEMMQNDVTYKQWSDVMGFEHHPKHYENCGEDCPVIGVTFWSILRFANCQSLREGLAPCYELNDCLSEPDCVSSFDASKFACEEAVVEAASCSGFRLASVGEWELATRGGTNSCLWNRAPDKTFGPCNEFDPLGRVAWFCANSFVDWEGCADCVGFQGDAQADCCGPHPVGQLEANPFGIKDPLGNVGHLMGTLADAAKPDAFPGKVRVDPGHPSAYARWSIGLDQPCSFRAPNSSCCLNIRTSGYLDYIQNGPIGFRLVRTVE